MERRTRRRVLATTGAALAAGLAGCTGDGGDGGGDGGSDGGDGGGGGGGTSLDVSSDARTRVDDFLTAEPATSNYDGTIAGGSTVDVGVEGNQGNYAFGPAAIAVETGTTVNWEWTGMGNQHNVVATGDSDFELDSGDPQTEDSYEFTFEEAGVALYECVPHKSLGMKGAVVAVASGG
ncbi:halocyanin domain-containing protein [Haloglomus litoreum]|uniref:halocyanin domain-containing protein n=1 Tax=Haloglomus litoreum TaxID=3034026 RepID=UPI0023E7750F|nr:halocyanin domain-containing protein [Haloglomus sp. DT116]